MQVWDVHVCEGSHSPTVRPYFRTLVDLREIFFRFRVGGEGVTKKSSENDQLTNDQLTGHFQSFFFNISRTNSKTSNLKVNQPSVLNL